MLNEFYGDKILLTFHEISSFYSCYVSKINNIYYYKTLHKIFIETDLSYQFWNRYYKTETKWGCLGYRVF